MGGGASKKKVVGKRYVMVQGNANESRDLIRNWIANPIKDGRRIGQKALVINNFKLHGCIATGRSAAVRLAHFKKTKRYYAIKCINKSWIIENHEAASVRSELAVHSSLSHRFIANFFSAFQNHSFVFIVQEYCVGGPLSNFTNAMFSPEVAKFYMAEVASALAYLHKVMSVVHRDLNEGNVMISQLGHVKLVDFGHARRLSTLENIIPTADVPIPKTEYCAPEMIPVSRTLAQGLQLDQDESHSFAVDWWAFGIMLFKLVSGTYPFSSKMKGKLLKETDTYGKICEGRYSYPDRLRNEPGLEALIGGTLRRDQAKRFAHSQIIANPWFKDLNLNKLHTFRPPYVPGKSKVEGDKSEFTHKGEPPRARTLQRSEFAYCDFSKAIDAAVRGNRDIEPAGGLKTPGLDDDAGKVRRETVSTQSSLHNSEEMRNSPKAAISLGMRRKPSARISAGSTLEHSQTLEPMSENGEKFLQKRTLSIVEKEKRKSVAAAAQARRRTMK